MGQNAPSRPTLNPQGHKIFLFGMSVYKNSLIKKILDLYAIEKELVRPYQGYGRHTEF